MGRVLVLAGTTEATELAGLLDATGHDVVSSLAGVTSAPLRRPGRVRSGGFGGTAGLAAYLRDKGVDAVVDATHPFAAVMPFHAFDACSSTGIPHRRLLRAPWTPVPGDRWVPVPHMAGAAAALDRIGAERVFLATGRQQAEAFAGCAQWFAIRSIEPVTGAMAAAEAIRDRGPFTLEGELALLRAHDIDTVVAKNAGGTATAAKLDAARTLGLAVVLVERPPGPVGATVLPTAAAAAAWVTTA
jgi:precorrin-6A/cobalt-precorrin-6A reductase